MEGITVQVESKIIDGNPQLAKLGTIAVKLASARITIADLIRRTVEEQVWDLMSRRKLAAEEARRALNRQYLSEAEVAAQASRGAVALSRGTARVPKINVEEEVRDAIRAFSEGTYMIVVNGRQAASLADEVSLAEAGKVTFLRLTPLVGG